MIFRTQHNKENPYFMLNRAAVEDDRLSFKAVGIINYLLSKPDNWIVQETDLINRHTDGSTAIRSGLVELKKYGYFKKVAVFDETTHRITGWETHVFETPQDEETHNVENPPSGNPTLWETDPIVINDSLVSNEGSETPARMLPIPPLANGLTAGELSAQRGKAMKYCQDYDWRIHRATFEAVIDAMGKRALVDADDTKTISDWQQVTVTLTKAGQTAETIRSKTPAWKDSYWGKRDAAPHQFISFMGSDTTPVNGNNADKHANVINLFSLLENANQ